MVFGPGPGFQIRVPTTSEVWAHQAHILVFLGMMMLGNAEAAKHQDGLMKTVPPLAEDLAVHVFGFFFLPAEVTGFEVPFGELVEVLRRIGIGLVPVFACLRHIRLVNPHKQGGLHCFLPSLAPWLRW